MKRREMKLLLEERFERIALLETRIDTMDQLVEGYRAREQAILDTLQSAKERTAKMLADAGAEAEQTRAKAKAEAEELVRLVKEEAERTLRTARAEAQHELFAAKEEAERMRASAKAESDALLTDASAVSGSLRADAEKRTAELVAIAKADSDRMLRDVEIIKREYEEMVETFNAMLAQNATELEVTAARFAEFVKDRKIDPPEIRMDGDAFYKSVGVLNDAALPDASENPAMLMQNIYRIQNRPLPEDFLEERAASRDEGEEKTASESEPDPQANEQNERATAQQMPKFPMEEGSGADERQATVEPYSEAAWVNEAQESESEPQAEFTKAFEDAFEKSEFVVRPDACQLTQENATEAFDAAFAAPSFAASAVAAVIPMPVTAGVASHAETEQVFDEIFGEQFGPSGKLAQDAVEPQQATGPEGAKPEPYSEAAWANEAQESKSEPQAEFTKAFENAFDKSDFVVRSDACQLTQENATEAFDAAFAAPSFAAGAVATAIPTPVTAGVATHAETEQVFDEIFSEQFGPSGKLAQDVVEPQQATGPEGAKPEPYSEAAWATGEFLSDHEPQAEGALFSGEPEREVAPAAGESVPAADAENVIDDYFANFSAFGPTTASAPEPAVKPEPYSEAAWVTGAFTSDHEPQAEGALFSGEPEREAAPAAGESVPAADADNVIDDYFANFSAFGPTTTATTPEPAAKPEPYSETAWATGAFTSDHEPQAEGALFSGEAEPTTEPTGQTAINYDTTAASAFDSYFPSFETTATPETEPAAKPEPYSESAWATGTFTSDHEPQAEGNLFAEEAEEEPAPAPRQYNEYGQVREWEPEPEPDMDDIPTVSRYMGRSEPEGEISLDELLDEIIKAGE